MSIEIQKAQKSLAAELAAAEKRHARAIKTVEDARAALKAAEISLSDAEHAEREVNQEYQTLLSKYNQFLELFPLESATEVKETAAAKPKGKKKPDMTLIEKMLLVIGDKTMGAGQIEHELITRGLHPSANNLRSYIHTILGSQTLKVKDANGNMLRDPHTNELVRVMVFKKVDRGQYCVNKIDPEKIMADLAASKPTEKSEVLLVNNATPQSPADALFASQGLDVASLASSTAS